MTVDSNRPKIGIPQRMREFALNRPREIGYTQITEAGTERAFRWAEIDRRSSQIAGALSRRGLKPGDRLSIALRNSPEFLFTTLAAWKVGAVPVPMRWDLPDWELERLTMAIDGKLHIDPSDGDWLHATAFESDVFVAGGVSPHIFGICSGGSTGLPKVVLHNRPALIDAALNAPFAEMWGRRLQRPQRICVLGPMYHANALGTLYQFLEGDQLVVLEKFDAATAVDVIERHRITGFHCTPTMLKRLADLPDIKSRDLSSLDWILQGGAPMPPSLVEDWCRLIGPEKVLMAYGMSESLGIVALNGSEWWSHRGSAGRPLRGTQIRILDDYGKECPDGEIGEIYLRSPAYGGSRYLGGVPPLAVTADGYRSVGDLGYLDDDGYLYVVERRTDLIITGGANVYPAEVEAALIDHPKVADVVVVGLKDEQWGRRVHAIVEPKSSDDPPSFDELRMYAKGKIAAYKAPHSMEILDSIPRSAATKVNRGALVAERGG